MTLAIATSRSYATLLPRHLCGLGLIFDHAITAKDLPSFLSIVGQDIVDFFTKSPYLKTLRTSWEEAVKRHLTLMRKAEKKLVLKIRQVYLELSKRISATNLSEEVWIKRHLKFINDILSFRYVCGNTPFYSIALGMLNGLCSELLKKNRLDVIDGVAEVSSNHQHGGKAALTASTCCKEREKFAELQASFNPIHSSPWQPWFLLQVLKDCMNLSREKFSSICPTNPSEKESLKNSAQLRRFTFWKDLRLALEGVKDSNLFNRDLFVTLIESMIRQIFVQESAQEISANSQEKIHSLVLELQSEELWLTVKKHDTSTPNIYVLREFAPESDPLMFIRTLLNNPGIKIDINAIPCFCSISKLVERTNLKGILADIFIPHRKKGIVVLPSKEILFSDLKQREKLLIHELLPTLKVYH